jgi:hypothetical protein
MDFIDSSRDIGWGRGASSQSSRESACLLNYRGGSTEETHLVGGGLTKNRAVRTTVRKLLFCHDGYLSKSVRFEGLDAPDDFSRDTVFGSEEGCGLPTIADGQDLISRQGWNSRLKREQCKLPLHGFMPNR